MADEAEAKRLQAKLKGHFGHISRELERWKGVIELAASTKLDMYLDDMLKSQAKCKEILDTCTTLTIDANVLEPDETKNDEILSKWEKKYDVCTRNS